MTATTITSHPDGVGLTGPLGRVEGWVAGLAGVRSLLGFREGFSAISLDQDGDVGEEFVGSVAEIILRSARRDLNKLEHRLEKIEEIDIQRGDLL
ncbi:MAG: hypothetical protein ACE1Z9_07910, partial [Acidimicrobiia bacterium]